MTPPFSLEEAWQICGDLFSGAHAPQRRESQHDVRQELLFCLLGGHGITYELARSAANVIASLEPFARHWDERELLRTLIESLSTAQFEPRRRNGALRRYRFPASKASTIVAARRWIELQEPLDQRLQAFGSAHEMRRVLCQCPGVGMKTASWVLRNVGLGSGLAIIDIHITRALIEAGRLIAAPHLPRDYELAERAFIGWCNELNAPPAAFDLFIWEWQRGSLRTSSSMSW